MTIHELAYGDSVIANRWYDIAEPNTIATLRFRTHISPEEFEAIYDGAYILCDINRYEGEKLDQIMEQILHDVFAQKVEGIVYSGDRIAIIDIDVLETGRRE